MTMRLDLRTVHYPWKTGATFTRPDCYGCADCGKWFQFARDLLSHIAHERQGEWDG